MKFISIASSLLLVVAAASGKENDSFDKQAEAAIEKAEEAIEKASHLRGSAEDEESEDVHDEESEDALVAVDKQRKKNNRRRGDTKNTPRRANQWLKAHNDQRENWQSKPQVMMKWSDDLKDKAEFWAEELVRTCKNRKPPKKSGLAKYGFNVAVKQGHSDFRTVDEVFKLWYNKLYLGYPNNREMSQVLWKATEYVGCADAGSADNASKTCTASVCFYARAGNCGMGQINSWDEHLKKINDERSCGPCPVDHPDCKECNARKKNGRKVRC